MSFASTAAPLSKAEKAYIQSALTAQPALRADGRGPLDFRPVALQTGVAPLANGSARVRIGGGLGEAGGGTEVLAAVKLEIEVIDAPGAGAEARAPGRLVCAAAVKLEIEAIDAPGAGAEARAPGRLVCAVTWCVPSLHHLPPRAALTHSASPACPRRTRT